MKLRINDNPMIVVLDNGKEKFAVRPGDTLVTIRSCVHGDSFSLVSNEQMAKLPAGTKCIFVCRWTNCYGYWFKVRIDNIEYDLRESVLALYSGETNEGKKDKSSQST